MRTLLFLWLCETAVLFSPAPALSAASTQGVTLRCLDEHGRVKVPEAEIAHIGKDVSAPQVVATIRPADVDPSCKAQKSYVIVFEGIIDREGTVCAVRVVKPEPSCFTEPYFAALRQWRYKPATRGGKP